MYKPIQSTGQRGGNRHPLSSRQFVLDHLGRVGSDYPANIHRAYKAELDEVARDRNRSKPYHYPTYQTFYLVVWKLSKEGLIKPSGHQEETDAPQFAEWDQAPMRVFYQLA